MCAIKKFVFCEIRCFSFVAMSKKKNKKDIRRLDPEVSIISSKNEGEVPIEQYYTLDKFLFSAG